MNKLEELGIFSGADEQHVKDENQKPINAGVFFHQSGALLDKLGPVVMEEVVPNLEDYFGRWNPGGFMVFPLGMHEAGSIRLHVWPSDAPRETDTGPSIHSHAWHLSSLILKGVYEDTLYDLEVVEASENEGLPKLYRSRFGADGKDFLVSDGERVRPIALEERSYTEGEKHFISAGVPHLPHVPAEQTTATIVVDSPAFEPTTKVVLYPHMEQDGTKVARPRVIVDVESALNVKAMLLD